MIDIQKNITEWCYDGYNKKNEWIVVHYVGAVSSAKDNAEYFKSANRKAGASYFVDDNSIWQSVDDTNGAWHIGDKGSGTYKQQCTNWNSIGIEMCCKKDDDGKLFITDATIANTIDLIKYLMKKYGIDDEHVIRHYDVTNKRCPNANGLLTKAGWKAFKNKLSDTVVNDKTFKVKINCYALNYRADANASSKINGQVHRNEVYTIVETKNGWGKLKSGAGWINLNYTLKVA